MKPSQKPLTTAHALVPGFRQLIVVGVTLALVLGAGADARAQQPKGGKNPLADINWKVGPVKVEIGDMAQMDLPDGYIYAGRADTRKLMEMTGNPPSGKELGFLSPKDLSWFIVFEFDDIGYIEDAEEEDLDADDILDSIKAGNEQANKMRQQKGWSQLTIEGWLKAPFYDKGSKNLQWAIKGMSEGKPVVNYNTRVLGRKGVMAVNLVINPDKLEATLPVVKNLIEKYSFVEGQAYAEYKPGDKIAKYGLAALVTGVGVAAAAKTGLLAKLLKFGWKILLVIGVAFAAAFKKVIGLFGGGKKDEGVVQRGGVAGLQDDKDRSQGGDGGPGAPGGPGV